MPHKVQSTDHLTPTIGERLHIERNRLGLSQRQMARKHKLTLTQYSKMERELEAWPHKVPAIGRLAPHERCVIMRRRSGKTQAEIALELGRCRYWINRVEAGLEDCTELACYWEQ